MLIIIESPGKRVSIAKYTGAKVMASFGHIKDLHPKQLSVDLKTMEPTFDTIDQKQKDIIKAIKDAAKNEDVYIATDKDREGDAIAVFIYQEIKSVAKSVYRAKFGEITKEAVQKGIDNAVEFKNINWGSFYSFLGRRVGDRIVGFLLSPVAHKATNWDQKDYMSVGRVQSIAVRMIVDRANEIKNFIPKTSFNVSGTGEKNSIEFNLKLNRENFKDKKDAEDILNALIDARTGKVSSITEKQVTVHPKAPYVTASLLADASSKLGLNAEKTMFLAQKLYEGAGSGGYITYMRTDSEILSDEYAHKVGEFLSLVYPGQYNGIVKRKSKHSQAEAHEAIRPSMHPSEAVKMYDKIKTDLQSLGAEVAQKAADLFKMITERTIKSQMSPAIYNKTDVMIDINGFEFKASGKVLKDPGFYALGKDDDDDEENESNLPKLNENEIINVKDLKLTESTTEAPKQYTEASIIKELEKKEIGRPSTYVSTVKILTSKNYAVLEQKYLKATQKAFALIEFLNKEHQYVIDYNFTADMESFLDKVEEDGLDWKDFVKNLFEKMGGESIITNRSSGPTPRMVEIAKQIAEKNNIELNPEILSSFEATRDFLETHISKTPSEAQINFAKNLANQLNIDVSIDVLENKDKLKAWIDINLPKSKGMQGLSEKQIAIIERNAPENIKKLIGKNTPEANTKLKNWLTSYFNKKD